MGQRRLTQEEREQIYLCKKSGANLQTIADGLKILYECARKWWRRGKQEGLSGLVSRKRGRPAQGLLSQFAPEIRQTSLNLKRKHKRWGAARILLEIQQMASLSKQKLPSRSHLYSYFREHCSECLNLWTKHKEVPRPARATAVHEVWQVDHQEGHRLGNGSIATVCNVRDPYGAAMIASQAFDVKTEKHWRKLTWAEVGQVLRVGFGEWQTLPE